MAQCTQPACHRGGARGRARGRARGQAGPPPPGPVPVTRAPHFQPVTLNYSSDPFNPDCPGDGCHLLHFRDEQVRSGGRPALMSGLRPRPIASWPDALTLWRPTGSQSRRVNQTSEKGRTQVIPCSLSPLPPHHVPFSVRVSLSSCLLPPCRSFGWWCPVFVPLEGVPWAQASGERP